MLPLRGKQQRFVEEYLIDLNATQAALRAGYSPKTAHTIGWENLQKPAMQAAIAAAMAERASRTEITQDRVLQELAVVDFSDIRHYHIDDTGNLTLAAGVPDAAYRAISSLRKRIRHSDDGIEYDTEVRLWNKVGTLRLTAQHLGMLKEQIAIQADVHVHLETAKARVAQRIAHLAAERNGHDASLS